MNKLFALTMLLAATGLIIGPLATAQEASQGKSQEDVFMLEEITVTAEKRSANLQDLASSVVALPGDTLVAMGKITTEEILESVPNVRFNDGGAANPENNISIRGIQRTQDGSIPANVLPATTGIYVDGVYQGIGGHYDVNRVEVLRGPQGTLYGRSATGGVVAFYTNDPKLETFEGSVRFEVGTDNLLNAEDVINLPVGDKVAIRAAGRYYRRDGYFDPQGGEQETKEGRLKVLYQPTDALRFVLAGSMKKVQKWGGGWTDGVTLTAPGVIDFQTGEKLDYVRNYPHKYSQVSLNTEYDLGGSILTWIAAYRDYEYYTVPQISYLGNPLNNLQRINFNHFPVYNVHTEEVRWQSDSDGPFSWLIGANYYYEEYEEDGGATQVYAIDITGTDLPPIDEDVPFNKRNRSGTVDNYGLFTEETYELTDDLRITAGLRYDQTKCISNYLFMENFNFPYEGGEPRQNPPIWGGAYAEGKKSNFDNITYKLRFEYDLSPDSMVYVMTSTGFLPGFVGVTPTGMSSDDPDEFFEVRQFDEQKLTSYEIGTKNQFLQNRLRVNAAMFYYDQEGWPNNYNLNVGVGKPSPVYIVIGNDIFGLEAEIEYLLTMNDRLLLNLGYLKSNQKDYPESVGFTDGINMFSGPGEWAIWLDETPGYPEWEGSVAYDHTFTFADGSMLVPRVEFNYKSGYYLDNLNKFEYDEGFLPYLWQDANVLCNASLSWTSASQMYRATLWIRNAFDEQYLTFVSSGYGADVGDPQTVGLSLSAKF